MKRAIFPLILTLVTACSSTVQTSSGAAFAADRGPIADKTIAAAVAGEPDLQFPARIGVARVIERKLTDIPAAELRKLAEDRPSPDPLGTFVPVSTFLADTLSDSRWRNPIRTAQVTAAKQHLDYVLIYKLSSEGWGLGRNGRGEAMIMDVRSGYIYGTATTTTNIAGYPALSHPRGPADRIIANLAPDVATMFNTLHARAQGS